MNKDAAKTETQNTEKTYATVSKKQKLNTSAVAKVVGGLHCRKAGGDQQE